MENKKTKIVSMIAIIALVLTVITATYAYFQAQTGEGSQTDVKITASTVDTLSFETGSSLTFTADQDTFANGKASLSDTTFAKAILTANNKTNTATNNYNLYLNISDNNFTYTQDTNTPELLLQITDASNNSITSIDGLTYKTVTDDNGTTIKGFDITTEVGLITILNNRAITTTSTKTEEWNITVTFVNYNKDQSANAGKSFSATLLIQKESFLFLSEYVISQYTGVQGENSIYYHSSSLSDSTADNSYRYAGSSETTNNFVCFGSDEKPCPTDNLYRIIGVFEENYHGITGQQLVKLIKYDYANSNLLGQDGNYNNNYTPNEKYYKGKLSSIDSYVWYKTDYSNTWSNSLLNKTNLNINFIDNIGKKWAEKIQKTLWKIGSNNLVNILGITPSIAYQNEVVNPNPGNYSTDITYEAKIGLMYVTDYYFASHYCSWTTDTAYYNSNCKSVNNSINWMYMGASEWTISRDADTADFALYLSENESPDSDYVTNSFSIRPTFLLTSTTLYVSGSGTMNDPIIIN